MKLKKCIKSQELTSCSSLYFRWDFRHRLNLWRHNWSNWIHDMIGHTFFAFVLKNMRVIFIIAEPWKCFPDLELAYFRFNTHASSLNQGSVFKVQQCAHRKTPLLGYFGENLKTWNFLKKSQNSQFVESICIFYLIIMLLQNILH